MVRLLIAFLILVLTNVSYGQVIPDIDWQNCYGGSNGDQGFAIGLANDNDYVFAGNSSSTNADVTDNHGGGDIWVVRIDSNSNIEWQKCLGGTSFDDARSMISMPDGNFVIGGYTMSNDGDVSVHYGGDINRDFWIVKLNEFGNILWEKSLGGSNDDVPHSIIYNDLNEIITLGYTSSNDYDVIEYNGNTDVWLTLQNEAGEVQWTKCYGGSMSDNGYSVINAWDYGYLLVGSTYSNDIDVSGNHGESDMWVIKIDTIGNINWQKCIGGSGGDVGKSVCKTLDGNYMIAGVTGSFDGDIEGNHGATDFLLPN
ncbi:MAG: hypothetical protein IPO47_04850 [Bacteroidetes bacterium]|nr:hypothetical protein [Bacteroidota bacterium]